MISEIAQKTEFTWMRWLPIALVVAGAILVGLAILVFEVNNEITAGILIGFLLVQILLAAVWTTLAPLGVVTRLITGTVFVLFLCLCMYRCAHRDGGGTGIAVAITGTMLAQWILFQIPLWYMRFKGWRLSTTNDSSGKRREDVQFGIKHLLIWTSIVAAFMGIARLITPHLQFDSNNSFAEALHLGSNLTLGNSLIALPVIWGCLSRNYFWLWIIVTVAVCIVVSLVQTLLEGAGSMHSEFLWTVNAAQMSISIFAMLAIRFTGNRLNRVVYRGAGKSATIHKK